uniref:TSC22 domain family protein 1 n=1 Tax=Bursaphelenchus xylophilus TaxID=6326 RepID=A0A1I7RR62_BURXY
MWSSEKDFGQHFADLVKTHLMFAVREEVENLRSRIMELETTVVHLEAENSILREHVPQDVLQSLSIQPQTGGLATMG